MLKTPQLSMKFRVLRRKAYADTPTTQKVKIRDKGKLSLATASDAQYIIKGNNHHQEH